MKKIFVLLALLTGNLTAAEPFFFTEPMIQSHMKGYSEEEKGAIEKDLAVVRSVCIPATTSSKPLYIATAGAPGARKSTILERFLKAHPELSEVAYLDPDQRGLKFMAHTYISRSLSSLALGGFNKTTLAAKMAYEKWRGGSNYIALTLLEEAFAQKKSIAHGTTSTGDHIPDFLSKVKGAGYEITLLLCSAEDGFRQKAIEYRNEEQKFYQSSPEDAIGKWRLFPQRMKAYFTYADTLYLFWSDDLETTERLAAVVKGGVLHVENEEAYSRFVSKYNRDRQLLLQEGKQVPAWEELARRAS
jgi:hypothetical protein